VNRRAKDAKPPKTPMSTEGNDLQNLPFFSVFAGVFGGSSFQILLLT
jgi:hypothetical protein